ncbi:MAG: hypothetical protein DIJKHBIC_02328 [Thermoanaerobaculia bacterium]|nr:hypothetical protein [Thermoanaerobaculia bacterium]
MKIFDYRENLVRDYETYVKSFISIADERIRSYVDETLQKGLLWPEPLIQMNPAFEPGDWIDELAEAGTLHPECAKIFRREKAKQDGTGPGFPLRLHRHQADAIRAAQTGKSYVLTTGTGSGKSLSYIVPIVDHVLRRGSGKGIQAIIVYPMNALANSQIGELQKFLCEGYPDRKPPVTFALYTGQQKDDDRERIIGDPPDILLTNYVMLELLLTRPKEDNLIKAAKGMRFLVLDELHTYRGRQGADVAMLVRRVRNRMESPNLQCVGTSATLASSGDTATQKEEVARVASILFGNEVPPENVIGETLRRATKPFDFSVPKNLTLLRERVSDPAKNPPAAYAEFLADPLSSWIESTFGVTEESGTDRLIRVKSPKPVGGDGGAAKDLSNLIGVPEERCASTIRETLLAGYELARHPETNSPAFAFRLHQFISRGDTVYASVEPEAERYITVHGQQFVPGDREKVLLPLVFCRECGQEYYCVREKSDKQKGGTSFLPRELSDRFPSPDGDPGFLFRSEEENVAWPDDLDAIMERIPEDWLEERKGKTVIRSNRKKQLPVAVTVGSNGAVSKDGTVFHFIPAPFRFCLRCGISYGGRQIADFGKLGSLGTEGRSTATTILALSAIRHLRNQDLPETARKLLSFTDNRQDASLQAGHFNDFVEVGILRAGLFKAAEKAGSEGLSHDVLPQRVFEAMNLPLDLYAADPAVRYQQLNETHKAFRSVLGYRIYRDLKRGWRITAPNLEQCGMLEIRYRSLQELCHEEADWRTLHPVLSGASPELRAEVSKTLLDHMRRELAIKVDFLTPTFQESIRQQSSQRLRSPFALDENETDRMETSSIMKPCKRPEHVESELVRYLTGRGGFGQYLRRKLPFEPQKKVEQTDIVIRELLATLKIAGLVEIVEEPRSKDDVPGYQIPASSLQWVAGDGTKSFHDPIRVPREPVDGGRTNPFFVQFYRAIAGETQGLEAREHTAQVPSQLREKRESDFRNAALPILFCSPTMELGVDISELNVVNLRNIPPTPANYAQRSGRAGRNGQPAMVFSYCAVGNNHDQYFFKRPEQMVAGSVMPPRLDLTNEDLIRAHVHSIWLAETKVDLKGSLKDILDVIGEEPTLALQGNVQMGLASLPAKERARKRAKAVLDSMADELVNAPWYTPDWLDRELDQVLLRFDRACDRWRGLYRSALDQQKTQSKIVRDASRTDMDKQQAKRLRAEAEAQLKLLTEVDSLAQSDFFSYRYFASEGFLPGYSFPRLPLSAFIPGRKSKQGDEFLQRPRFLAISEFGPRAFIYHEGSRYLINRVMLPVGEENAITERRAKICPECGYLHELKDAGGPDLCENCTSALTGPTTLMTGLLRLQNVSTRRQDKINSDEEERFRMGYDLQATVRFSDFGGVPTRTASATIDGKEFLNLRYGQAATIWRINLGWSRRKDKGIFGFVLDRERGVWGRNDLIEDKDQEDPMSAAQIRVIPFVEDRRNCLLLKPALPLPVDVMASLQYAIKNAIQVEYQLEDNELAVEPLPNVESRNLMLLYESAEGGAGVLRRLVEEPAALPRVARKALELCHFDPVTGEDQGQAPKAHERCESACYDCLLSYGNQRDHRLLDRNLIRETLLSLASAPIEASASARTRTEHLEMLLRQAESNLERQWLEYLEEWQLRLPSRAQKLLPAFSTRPDFTYEDDQTVIYVDGPHHDFPERQKRDREQEANLDDAGFTVIRFGLRDDWDAIVKKFPDVFGTPNHRPGTPARKQPASPQAPKGFDPDLFPDKWVPVLQGVSTDTGVRIEPGTDIEDGGRVIGSVTATIVKDGVTLHVIDTSLDTASDVEAVLKKRGERSLQSSPETAADLIRSVLSKPL